MDQGSIGGAMDWSSEIVEAINNAKTILFLISKDSVTSHNCAKEIHLANEKHKNILPVVLEETPLPVLFEYPLAGLQRVPYERTDAILHALEVLRSGKSVFDAMLTQSRINDGSIRLAVLPFEDRSPSQDNDWFADGMTDDLIDTLGSLSNMKVNARGDVIYYKKNRPKLAEIAADLNVDFVVEGSVQKAGQQIRIKVSLTDTLKHEQIWSGKYDGVFDDIFTLQDKTCYAISEAIRHKLTPEDKQKIQKKPTEHADAYELFLKGLTYFRRQTKADTESARMLHLEAVRLDPYFVHAHCEAANCAIKIYTKHQRDPKLLDEAREHIRLAEAAGGETADTLQMRSLLELTCGNFEEAVRIGLRAAERDPHFSLAYYALGRAYTMLKDPISAAEAFGKYVELAENDNAGWMNYVYTLTAVGDPERLKHAAERASHIYERYIRLNPDDTSAKVGLANIYLIADKREEALELSNALRAESLDSTSYYNLACLYLKCGDLKTGLVLLRRTIDAGYRHLEDFLHDTDLDPLRGIPEFEEIIKEMEKKIETEKSAVK